MDYLKQSLGFKIKKVLRYMGMYGFRRTYMKILGQKHMRRTYKSLPAMKGKLTKIQTVGIIGCGNYSFTTIAYFLRKEFGHCIAACMDQDINRAASYASRYKAPLYTDNADVVINNDNVRLIYIASNHASHAEYAIKALEAGKNVYIEKPHVVSTDQLMRLSSAMKKYDGKVFLGFNRPCSGFGKLIKDMLFAVDGPAMINWFVVGHFLEPDHWYLHEGEGGRVLGNLCHWTDFTLRLVKKDIYPITIVPARFDKSDRDMAVNLIFGDGTITGITFSSQGYTFEGVRESLRIQKGNVLIAMDDFKSLEIELMASKTRVVNYYHDHGHKNNVVNAYKNVHGNEPYQRDLEISHIENTAWLFLNVKEAVDRNKRIKIGSYEDFLDGTLMISAKSKKRTPVSQGKN
jgi:predicted dehydrogenase